VDYYGSAGVQHIALNTSDIIASVSQTYDEKTALRSVTKGVENA
jgi:4-hydroxyphenylpyruvate dioxygenase-like putative hemolysin